MHNYLIFKILFVFFAGLAAIFVILWIFYSGNFGTK